MKESHGLNLAVPPRAKNAEDADIMDMSFFFFLSHLRICFLSLLRFATSSVHKRWRIKLQLAALNETCAADTDMTTYVRT